MDYSKFRRSENVDPDQLMDPRGVDAARAYVELLKQHGIDPNSLEGSGSYLPNYPTDVPPQTNPMAAGLGSLDINALVQALRGEATESYPSMAFPSKVPLPPLDPRKK